jgi:hypothetical protein
MLGEEAVQQVDAALVIGLVCGEIVFADTVVDAGAGTANRSDHEIAGLEFVDVGSDRLHLAKTFVAFDEVIEAGRGRAVEAFLQFAVSAIHAHADNFDQHSAAVRDGIERGFGNIAQLGAVRSARNDGDGLHG